MFISRKICESQTAVLYFSDSEGVPNSGVKKFLWYTEALFDVGPI